MVTVRVLRSVLAVRSALEFGPIPQRLMGLQVFFPDIGRPTVDQVGILRYRGEPVLGDVEPVAPVSTSYHHV